MRYLIKYWSLFSGLFVTLVVFALVFFVAVKALPELSVTLFFGETSPVDAVFKGTLVWDGLWNPLYGTVRLMGLTALFAVPVGLSLGIYIAEYAGERIARWALILLDSLAGLPSIIIGLFGFVLILFLRRFFLQAAGTNMLLSAFCLGILVLPVLALNTYTVLRGLPFELRLTAASIGLSREATVFRVLFPAGAEALLSGLLLSAGRCAEDTAVILLTGVVASSHATGIFDKFEALPFFIYYTSANYQDSTQLAQVFVAAFLLLVLTVILLLGGMMLRRGHK